MLQTNTKEKTKNGEYLLKEDRLSRARVSARLKWLHHTTSCRVSVMTFTMMASISTHPQGLRIFKFCTIMDRVPGRG